MQYFTVGKCLKIGQKLHGGDGNHIKVCKKTKISNRQMSYVSPLRHVTSTVHISK